MADQTGAADGGARQDVGRPRLPAAAGVALYVLAAGAMYAPALRGGWLWDDREDVPDNVVLKLPGAAGLKLIWSGRAGLDYYPLKSTVQWIEWRMFGDATVGYHVVNLALHVATAALVWAILEKFALRRAWAFAGGLLFLASPVAVGSVAWMAELKDVLSMPLLLLAVIAWLEFEKVGRAVPRALDRGKPAASLSARGTARSTWYVVSLVFFAAAMLAKSSAMMLPIWLGLKLAIGGKAKSAIAAAGKTKSAVAPGAKAIPSAAAGGKHDDDSTAAAGTGVAARWSVAAALGRLLPYLLISIACGWGAVYLQTQRSMGSDQAGLGGLAFRAALAAQTLWSYAGHVAWPAGMLPVYFRWKVPEGVAAVVACWKWLPWAALAVWAWVRRDRPWARVALLAGGWFVLNLVPVLGLVGISFMRFSWVMDHLAYISLAGAAALAAAGLQWLANRAAPAAVGVTAVIAALSAAGTWRYAHAWQGEEQIWAYAAERGPNLWMPQGNLGSVLLNQGRFTEAEKHLARAERLDPDAPDPHRNLGVLYEHQQKFDLAIAEAKQALRLRPNYAMAENDLGTYYGQTGHFAEAAPYLAAAVQHVPGDPDSHNKYGVILGQLGKAKEAIEQFQLAAQLAPNTGEIELNLGTALGQAGRIKDALPHLELAAKLLPNNPQAKQNVLVARHLLGLQ